MKQRNTQKITEIIYRPKVQCFCPLGNDWYTNELKITMIPDEYFPDYCDIEAWLNENVRGKSLIIEEVVGIVYDYFIETYTPEWVEVESNVIDVTSHSPVTVKKM